MKKLFLCLTISAFALASSALADNNATTKTCKMSADQKTECCHAAKASCSKCSKSSHCSGKSACTKGMPSKSSLMSPKAAAESGK